MWAAIGMRIRALRRHRNLTQDELARLAGVSRRTVQRIESGLGGGVTHDRLRRVVEALGGTLRITLSWNGELLDRLIDSGHAELQNAFASMLKTAGWLVAVEVSFNHYGDRGRYDILAYHPASGVVLVVEVKTGIGDVQATLGSLDVKVRLAATVARQQGWPVPTGIVPALVIADERHQHRLVAGHAALFARFGLRGRTARAWVRKPSTGASGLLVYLPMTNARLVSVRKAKRGQRVRRTRVSTSDAPQAAHLAPMSSGSRS
jgi:transcriptional regulator with XRE-family HTH domain